MKCVCVGGGGGGCTCVCVCVCVCACVCVEVEEVEVFFYFPSEASTVMNTTLKRADNRVEGCGVRKNNNKTYLN